MAEQSSPPRRGFLQRLIGVAGFPAAAAVPAKPAEPPRRLPEVALQLRCHGILAAKLQIVEAVELRPHRRQFLTAGQFLPESVQELFNSAGPGIITHLWFTIAAPDAGPNHLMEIVLRAYWDGNDKAQHRNAHRGLLHPANWKLFQLPVGIYELFVGEGVELLFRHALPEVGALHRDQ